MTFFARFPKTFSRPSPVRVNPESSPPRPPLSSRNIQHGVHEREFDPCGRPPMTVLGSDEKESA